MNPDYSPARHAAYVLAGGGEMGVLMRAMDWSRTKLGPVETWPQSLRTAVRIILSSRYAMFVWWGHDLVNLYNDPTAIPGQEASGALGQSAREVWARSGTRSGRARCRDANAASPRSTKRCC